MRETLEAVHGAACAHLPATAPLLSARLGTTRKNTWARLLRLADKGLVAHDGWHRDGVIGKPERRWMLTGAGFAELTGDESWARVAVGAAAPVAPVPPGQTWILRTYANDDAPQRELTDRHLGCLDELHVANWLHVEDLGDGDYCVYVGEWMFDVHVDERGKASVIVQDQPKEATA